MAGSHITEQHTFDFCRSGQHELLNATAYGPRKGDSFLDYDLDFVDNYHDLNKSPTVTDTVDILENIAEITIVNQ